MRDRVELLEQVIALWDRVDRGEIKLKDLQAYEKIVRLYGLMAQADLTTARAELARAKAWSEVERFIPLPEGEGREALGPGEDAPV